MPHVADAGWVNRGAGEFAERFRFLARAAAAPIGSQPAGLVDVVVDNRGPMRRWGRGVTDLLRWGSLSVPERQLSRSGVAGAFAVMSRHRRITALAAGAIFAVASVGYFAAGYIRYQRLVVAEVAAMSRTASANADLQDALARMRNELGAANQALSAAQNRVSALSEEAHRQLASSEASVVSKGDRISQLTHALEQAQLELHRAEAQHATLLARLSKAEADLSAGQQRQHEAQAGLEQWQKKIQQLTAERDRAAAERDQLRARVGQLEKQSLSRVRQPSAVAAAPVPAAGPAGPAVAAVTTPTAPVAAVAPAAVAPAPRVAAVAPQAVPAVANVTAGHGGFAQIERVLASAGVDVEHVVGQYGRRTGTGGPFVPVPHGGPPTPSPEKLAALEQLVQTLPISAPLAGYRVGSPFGVRGDPMNGHREFHTGLDLLAPYESPVYATAPGVVTFSGYRDDYGKIVEIDHGHGIATRYAHLHRALVSVGQHVAAHQEIGLLGSSGRATGPHVHYEVVVNGEPQDPEKFLGLARLVRVAYR
jgi:murein DD-endopeptidase MepM/ murein hydrolase activator NlpD